MSVKMSIGADEWAAQDPRVQVAMLDLTGRIVEAEFKRVSSLRWAMVASLAIGVAIGVAVLPPRDCR